MCEYELVQLPVKTQITMKMNPRRSLLFAATSAVTAFRPRPWALAFSSRSSSVPTPNLDGRTLVSVDDCLDAYKNDPCGVVFCDASWYHRSARSGRDDFIAGPRLPGARYIDMDDIAAKGDDNPQNLPHMMPDKNLFAAMMDEFDITNDDRIVIYGRKGCVFTPRTWFLFQQCGHDENKLHLMQGSLEEWAEKGGAIEEGMTNIPAADDMDVTKPVRYKARNPTNVVGMNRMMEAVERQEGNDDEHSEVILDPRGSTFDKAHMPGAINIPYRSIVTEDDTLKFKPKEELQALFDEAGVDVSTDRDILLTCGSGVSVCHLWVALAECGRDNAEKTFVYDGSWAEWGAEDKTPKVSS